MSIPVEITVDGNKQSKSLIISFDVFGNLYLHDNINSDKIYQLNISGKNIPYFDFGNYEIINGYEKKLGTFAFLDKNKSLKTKIKIKIEKEINDYEEDNYNSDDEYDLDGDKNIDYYPEDNDHFDDNDDSKESYDDGNQEIDEENIKLYGYDNQKFTFWNNINDNPIPIFNRKDGDIMALYDVYIYDNDRLIFKSKSADNSSIYRFRINIDENDDIYFRPIGYTEQQLKLKLNDDESLIFIGSHNITHFTTPTSSEIEPQIS